VAGTGNGLKRAAQLGRGLGLVALEGGHGAHPGDQQFCRPAPGLEVAAEVHAAHHALARELLAARENLRGAPGQQVGQ
jgi:hypothetical protein